MILKLELTSETRKGEQTVMLESLVKEFYLKVLDKEYRVIYKEGSLTFVFNHDISTRLYTYANRTYISIRSYQNTRVLLNPNSLGMMSMFPASGNIKPGEWELLPNVIGDSFMLVIAGEKFQIGFDEGGSLRLPLGGFNGFRMDITSIENKPGLIFKKSN